jgi:hypothetical protein
MSHERITGHIHSCLLSACYECFTLLRRSTCFYGTAVLRECTLSHIVLFY